MFMILKKRHILYIVVTIIVFTTYLVCSTYFNSNKEINENTTTNSTVKDENIEYGDAVYVSSQDNNLITKAKNDRELMRSRAIELLKSYIQDETSDEFKKQAEDKILKIASDMDTEIMCESLLCAKGYDNNVVFISDNCVTITIALKSPKEEDIMKIKDIVFEQTGNNNIKIVEVM